MKLLIWFVDILFWLPLLEEDKIDRLVLSRAANSCGVVQKALFF